MADKINVSDYLASIKETIAKPRRLEFIPTGLQDLLTVKFCTEDFNNFHVQSFNDLGKTTWYLNLVREICSPSGSPYFDFPMIKNWPFPKSIAIVSIKESLKEPGAVYKEINTWWPKELHDGGIKGDLHYNSLYKWKTGFTVKLISNEIGAAQLESNVFGLVIVDEPCAPEMISALNTRLKEGGKCCTIFTPVTVEKGHNPGPVLDVLEDLERRGRKVFRMEFNDIQQNRSDTGLMNRQGTKRGLRTEQQLIDYCSGVSSQQYDARIKGIFNLRSGRIYPEFNAFHVKHFDFTPEQYKTYNAYMAMDPHRSAYPFLLWAVYTPREQWIVYNEWPQYETLGMYYDEARKTLKNTKYQVSDIAAIIRALDWGDEQGKTGFRIMGRVMDPMFGKADEVDFGRDTKGVVQQFVEQTPAIKFVFPDVQRIAVQRNTIQGLLRLANPGMPFVYGGNEPSLYILPHCRNFIRSMQRHYDEPDGEAEEYKDPVDCKRYMQAAFGSRGYVPPVAPEDKKKSDNIKIGLGKYEGMLNNPGLI